MDFFSELEAIAHRNDVLRHPFYVRWSAGELRPEELADYAGQYRHAVVALAGAAADAACIAARGEDAALATGLADHAAEEASHVALWDRFVDAVGGERDAVARPATAACAEAWSGAGERGFDDTLVALYAIEAAQPAISATKRAGLAEHYGVADAGASYFELHETLDVEHASAGRRLIEARLDRIDQQCALAAAETVLRANWELLDGMERVAA
jgi:pyrroloquinoline-quinone synthase